MFNWSWIHILCTRIRWWINWIVIIKTYIKFSFDTIDIFLKNQEMEHLNDTIRPQKNKKMIWSCSLWSTNTHMTPVIICKIKLIECNYMWVLNLEMKSMNFEKHSYLQFPAYCNRGWFITTSCTYQIWGDIKKVCWIQYIYNTKGSHKILVQFQNIQILREMINLNYAWCDNHFFD